jgi:hypothetical protein
MRQRSRPIDLLAPANFSADRQHRYSLCRRLKGPAARVLVSCGYNPSIADERGNTDRTIAREIDFATRWGYGVLIKINVFAGVGMKPKMLAVMDDPVGRENDAYIAKAIHSARRLRWTLLATWGAPKGRVKTKRLAEKRFRELMRVRSWKVLKILKHGHPGHPLCLSKDLTPLRWKRTRGAAG